MPGHNSKVALFQTTYCKSTKCQIYDSWDHSWTTFVSQTMNNHVKQQENEMESLAIKWKV